MYCTSCGTENVDTAQFCNKCGSVQVPSSPTPAQWPGSSQPNYPPQPPPNQTVQGYAYTPSYPTASYPPPPPAPNPYAPAYGQMQPQQITINNPAPRPVVVMMPKSVGAAIALSFFFGPLGMMYSTVVGGLVMIFVNLIVAIPTLGLGLLITQPICIIWAAVAASQHNSKLYAYAHGGYPPPSY
jgi:hypothetical protein